mgnify:CR=1 FL=1
MGLIQKVKDFFNRGRYNMQTSNLNSILDHPKIAVSQEEYSRIQHNLTYYQSKILMILNTSIVTVTLNIVN